MMIGEAGKNEVSFIKSNGAGFVVAEVIFIGCVADILKAGNHFFLFFFFKFGEVLIGLLCVAFCCWKWV